MNGPPGAAKGKEGACGEGKKADNGKKEERGDFSTPAGGE